VADNLHDMTIFVRVVENGSLSAAARSLNMTLPVVSRRLARLESRLGVRLLNRTTRTLALTDEGERFYRRCVQILADLADAETEAAQGSHTVRGRLRITATVAFGRKRLAPILRAFQVQHPDLHVHFDASDAVVNIVDAGYDLAIRFGALQDSALIARQIAPNYRVIVGAPGYLRDRGRPKTLADLAGHDAILLGTAADDHWHFADGQVVRVASKLSCNDGEIAHDWAVQGAGLVIKSIWDVIEDIEAGKLEIVLPDIALPASPIHAVFPHRRHVAAKVRLCVDFIAQRLRDQMIFTP